MQNFDDIRPYHDDEVRPVLQRLVDNRDLLRAVTGFRWPLLSRWANPVLVPLVRRVLAREVASVADVRTFQAIIEKYMRHMIATTTDGYSVSGLDSLDRSAAYLYLGNHRDIAMDPAFVNYTLYQAGFDTVRIAIGDNLLTRDYVSDLMRLNKSFIVRRSASGPRQMLAAYRQLSAYIRYSLREDRQSIWMAQREGRAKDGWDATDPTIIKMLALSQNKGEENFAELVAGLHIVPVAIAYEWDPCDAAKAAESHARAVTGDYRKAEQEDISSIARGISGHKGRVHVAFGRPLESGLDDPDAVAQAVDRQVVANYRLFPVNIAAFCRVDPSAAAAAGLCPDCRADEMLQQRLASLPAGHSDYLLAMYANCVRHKLALGLPVEVTGTA